MTIELTRFNLLLADLEHPDDPAHATEHELTILHRDQLRAEIEAPRLQIGSYDTQPFHNMTLWCWAVMRRTGAVPADGSFEQFRDRVLAIEPMDPDDGAIDGQAPTQADPTRPAAESGSPSPSPATSATSTAGSADSNPT